MKTAPLFICFLAAQLSFAADSLIVNAGSNSRVIFYGKSPADLKNLERLDLNKLLRDLNQTQDSTSERLQMSSESYRVAEKPLPKWKQFWQEYKKNTFFNFHVGMGTSTLFNEQPVGRYEYFHLNNPSVSIPNPPIKDFTTFNSLWLRTRSVVGVNLVHDAYLLQSKRAGLKLRYGVGVEALELRYEYSNIIKFDRAAFTDPQYQNMTDNQINFFRNTLGVNALQTDVRAMSYNFQLMPKVFLKNKKGRETFSFGIGVRYNLSYTRQPLASGTPNIWGIYSTDHDKVVSGYVVSRSNASSLTVFSNDMNYFTDGKSVSSFTFMAEIGYRSISLFAQYTPAFTQIQPNLRPNASANAQYFNQRSGNLGFVNFGLKFGR